MGILYPVIGQRQWYGDAASQAIKCICGLFGNILFLYSMKSILDLYLVLADAELIHNLSSVANCGHLILLISEWINLALIHVSNPHVVLFMLIFGLYILACTS